MDKQVHTQNKRRSQHQPEPSQVQPSPPSLHPLRELDQRHLEHYKQQKDRPHYPEDNCQQKLMQESTEHKRTDLGHHFAPLPFDYQLQIHMPVQKSMHRFVPLSVELLVSM